MSRYSRRITTPHWSTWNAIPWPKPDSGQALYHDCLMICPERLTLAFVRSASVAGALVANHTRAEELLTERGAVVGAIVRDTLTGRVLTIHCHVVVNATGPWVFDTLSESAITSESAPAVRSEGIYLITRQLTDRMTLHVTDHGHFSCAPWRGHSMIGPTEKAYRGPVSDWRITRESVEEFLAAINAANMLPVPVAVPWLAMIAACFPARACRTLRASSSLPNTANGATLIAPPRTSC